MQSRITSYFFTGEVLEDKVLSSLETQGCREPLPYGPKDRNTTLYDRTQKDVFKREGRTIIMCPCLLRANVTSVGGQFVYTSNWIIVMFLVGFFKLKRDVRFPPDIQFDSSAQCFPAPLEGPI